MKQIKFWINVIKYFAVDRIKTAIKLIINVHKNIWKNTKEAETYLIGFLISWSVIFYFVIGLIEIFNGNFKTFWPSIGLLFFNLFISLSASLVFVLIVLIIISIIQFFLLHSYKAWHDAIEKTKRMKK